MGNERRSRKQVRVVVDRFRRTSDVEKSCHEINVQSGASSRWKHTLEHVRKHLGGRVAFDEEREERSHVDLIPTCRSYEELSSSRCYHARKQRSCHPDADREASCPPFSGKSTDAGWNRPIDLPHCAGRSQKQNRSFPLPPPPRPPDSPTWVPPCSRRHKEGSSTILVHRSRLEHSHRSHRLGRKTFGGYTCQGCKYRTYSSWRFTRSAECERDQHAKPNLRQNVSLVECLEATCWCVVSLM